MRPQDVRVVLIGNEPPAFRPDTRPDGLAFSGLRVFKDYTATTYVTAGQMAMFDELIADQAINPPRTNHLGAWHRQGVMLWNWCPVSTTGTMGVWEKAGFEKLSREIIESLWLLDPRIVFVPWGVPDSIKSELFPSDALVVDGPGPISRQLAAFTGTRPFTKINSVLTQYSKWPAINWNINPRA